MIKILLVCSGGMSSSMVVKSLIETGKKENLLLEAKAVGTGEVEQELRNDWHALLIAPQIRHRQEEFQTIARREGIPFGIIEAQGYSPLGGRFLIKQVRELLSL